MSAGVWTAEGSGTGSGEVCHLANTLDGLVKMWYTSGALVGCRTAILLGAIISPDGGASSAPGSLHLPGAIVFLKGVYLLNATL